MSKIRRKNRIIAVGGGKGGVGKSVLSIALGLSLSKRGNRVVLIDLDLGAANLHTYLGIMGHTPSLADFVLRRVSELQDIVISTEVENLFLISGAEFVPGMANPAHWMKLKIIRHIRNLDADFIIIDLGAGVHFNILDFFGIADRGIVITAPEPGAVMNAYGFIKASFYRRIQQVFRKHPAIGRIIEEESKKGEKQSRLTLEWLKETIKSVSPEMITLMHEIEEDFKPALVINKVPQGQTHVLVKNLISLCKEKLGIEIEHVGNLPDVKEMPSYLLNIPKLLTVNAGRPYLEAVNKVLDRLLQSDMEITRPLHKRRTFFTDEEIEEIIAFIDSLDEGIFKETSRDILKLRMFFKPERVISFLEDRGITHELFYC